MSTSCRRPTIAPPAVASANSPASMTTAPLRSCDLATWPFWRASSFFLGVASSVFSPPDWLNTRRTFNGVRGYYVGKEWDVDLFWAQPVIPDFGEASDCVQENRFFCPDWVADNWGSVLQPALVQHREAQGLIQAGVEANNLPCSILSQMSSGRPLGGSLLRQDDVSTDGVVILDEKWEVRQHVAESRPRQVGTSMPCDVEQHVLQFPTHVGDQECIRIGDSQREPRDQLFAAPIVMTIAMPMPTSAATM